MNTWPPPWLDGYMSGSAPVAAEPIFPPAGKTLAPEPSPEEVSTREPLPFPPITAPAPPWGDVNLHANALGIPPGCLIWLDGLQCTGCEPCQGTGHEPDVPHRERLDQVWLRIQEQERRRLAKGPVVEQPEPIEEAGEGTD